MGFSKVIYFLFGGGVLASIAILIVLYQPPIMEEKDTVVPLVKEVIDAKPIEIAIFKNLDVDLVYTDFELV